MEEGAITSVKSHHQLALGNLVRQIMDLLAPCWAYNKLIFPNCLPSTAPLWVYKLIFSHCLPDPVTSVTGTIICPINGKKIKLCLQESAESPPFVLIELPLSTAWFSSLIQCGLIRIVLEPVHDPGSLHSWATYCNGQKAGFARILGAGEEKWVLERMQMVSAGAGILLHRASDSGGYKYLRGQFERVVGSDDSEAYHLTDPSHDFGQELSVFFLSN